VSRGFGIVGAGVIATIHADAIALLSRTGLPDARLVAVTGVAAGAAAALAAAQLADLLDAVDTGREPAVSGQSGRDALEIVLAVYESSRTGRPVSLGR
jgi:predicted dehydrogenase